MPIMQKIQLLATPRLFSSLRLQHPNVRSLSSTPASPNTTSTATPPKIVSRSQFEEDHHLQRNLSQANFDPRQIQKWTKQFQQETKPWTIPPLELFPSPRYEADTLKAIHSRSFDCNVLLEIRDVRLPASSHHPSFTRLARHRLHLIAYTHADLIDKTTRDRVEDWTQRSWPEARPIFLDTRENRPGNHDSFGLVYNSLMEHLEQAGGLNSALTVGVANTGKSSVLTNLLRHARTEGLIPKKIKSTSNPVVPKKRKKSNKNKRILHGKGGPPAVEDKPGKTKELTEYLIRDKPRAFFLDVPGLTPPKFFFEERPEAWYGMAAANLILLSKRVQDDAEDLTTICNFVLRCLNRDANFVYVKTCNLNDGPTTDINTVLDQLGGFKIDDPNFKRIKQCQNFLKFLNTGNFGPVILDDLRQPYKPFVFKDDHFSSPKTKKGSGTHEDDDYNDYVDSDDDDDFFFHDDDLK